MERLSARKKDAIIKLYLSGCSYDEVAAKVGVSKGTVFNVIAELKAGKFPEAAGAGEQIELLRELSIELKRSRLTPGQCSVGITVLGRINECGLDLADIDRWPLILKSIGNEDELQEFVKLVYSIQDVQKRKGMSIAELDNEVNELESRAGDLESIASRHKDYQKQIAEITERRDNLAKDVANLEEKYKLLNPRVKDLEKREHELSRRTKDLETKAEKAEAAISALHRDEKKLRDIGLTLEETAEFSQRLSVMVEKHNIPSQQLKNRLFLELENLDHALSQEELIMKDQQIKEEHEEFIAKAKLESEELKAIVGDLKREKASLEASIENTTESVCREIAKVPPIAMAMINHVEEKLRKGHNDILLEVRQITEAAFAVGEELGQHQETLRSDEWLHGVRNLAQGDESLDSKQVRVIASRVVRGTLIWLQHNKGNDPTFLSMISNAMNLVRNLEQWRI